MTARPEWTLIKTPQNKDQTQNPKHNGRNNEPTIDLSDEQNALGKRTQSTHVIHDWTKSVDGTIKMGIPLKRTRTS